jgi:hypothetical protein
MSKMSI